MEDRRTVEINGIKMEVDMRVAALNEYNQKR